MLSQDIVVCTASTTSYGRGVIVATWRLTSSKNFQTGKKLRESTHETNRSDRRSLTDMLARPVRAGGVGGFGLAAWLLQRCCWA